jgi:hypothetical protein
MVSSSSGEVVRRSMISQWMPASQLGGGLLGLLHHAAVGDDGHVVAFAHVGLAEGHGVALFRHLAFHGVEQLVLQEDHRVVVADRLDQQALGVVGVDGHTTFRPGMWVKMR